MLSNSNQTELVQLTVGSDYAGYAGYDTAKFNIIYHGNNTWLMKKPGAEQSITDAALTERMLHAVRKGCQQAV